MLDAFDECEEAEQELFGKKITDYFNSRGSTSRVTSRLKLLITSRPYALIYDTIHSFRSGSTVVKFDTNDKTSIIEKEIELIILA